MTTPLTESEYLSTMAGKMLDVTGTAEPVVDIWPYLHALAAENIVDPLIFHDDFVEKVYRNCSSTFEHVLLKTANKNTFIVIVVDLVHKAIKGHHRLDLNVLYGLT